MKSSPHAEKYRFHEPSSIREARTRMKMLLLDIRNIEKQLGDPVRLARDGSEMPLSEYRSWYSRIRASLVYKQTEYGELKDWVKERRRSLFAEEVVDVTNPDDPRQLLLVTRSLLREILDGGHDPARVGEVFTIIEQHLLHAA